MKKYSLITLLLIGQLSLAQVKDPVKMDRDLQVAQSALESIINDSQREMWGARKSENAQYISGYGVVITLPTYGSYFRNFNMPPPPPMPNVSDAIVKGLKAAEKVQVIIEDDEDLSEDERQAMVEERKAELEERRAEIEKRSAEIYERFQENWGNMQQVWINADSARNEKKLARIEEIKSFLLDYGNLISQLDRDEKILVIERSPQVNFIRVEEEVVRVKKGQTSLEATYGDILDFQAGKLSREEAGDRIVVQDGSAAAEVAKDLTVLRSVLERLYQEDLSETYFLKSTLSVQRLSGLGAIYYMDMASSKRAGNQMWRVPTQGEDALSQEDRDALVASLYTEFENNLVTNLLDYGEKIKSLKDDEQVIIKANITQCKGCNIPKTVEIRVQASVLKALGERKISEKQARKEVIITKGELQ